MKLSVLTRKIHAWGAIVIAVPVVIVIITGLLLQLKKQIPWIQPAEQRGSGREPTLALSEVLSICRTVPEAEIQSWTDIQRLDIRPTKGMMKVLARNNWEIQLDSQTGQVLQVEFRRSDIIESIHDGSFFDDGAKLWVFLPAGVILFVLWLTGLYLFFLPLWVRWRRKRAAGRVA